MLNSPELDEEAAGDVGEGDGVMMHARERASVQRSRASAPVMRGAWHRE
jgi:hypothetical protein